MWDNENRGSGFGTLVEKGRDWGIINDGGV